MKIGFKRTLAALALTAAMVPAHATVTYQTGTNISTSPGLTNYTTTGAMMGSLEITATFSNGFSQSLSWASTSGVAGGVTGTGWALSLKGDSYYKNWSFTFDPSASLDQPLGQLVSLELNGVYAPTVFDLRNPNKGTADSASGHEWTCESAGMCDTATVTYDYLVNIGSNAAIGDLYQMLLIEFGQGGPSTNFKFSQDTDNDIPVPEPSALLLLGAALTAYGIVCRRS